MSVRMSRIVRTAIRIRNSYICVFECQMSSFTYLQTIRILHILIKFNKKIATKY